MSDMEGLQQQIEIVISRMKFGTASAAKRGRNSEFPYVPVIKEYLGRGTHNPTRRRAYATREEAVAVAQAHIDAWRDDTRKKLADPCWRAFRKQWGLPEEILGDIHAA
jgi:hypothetical protein